MTVAQTKEDKQMPVASSQDAVVTQVREDGLMFEEQPGVAGVMELEGDVLMREIEEVEYPRNVGTPLSSGGSNAADSPQSSDGVQLQEFVSVAEDQADFSDGMQWDEHFPMPGSQADDLGNTITQSQEDEIMAFHQPQSSNMRPEEAILRPQDHREASVVIQMDEGLPLLRTQAGPLHPQPPEPVLPKFRRHRRGRKRDSDEPSLSQSSDGTQPGEELDLPGASHKDAVGPRETDKHPSSDGAQSEEVSLIQLNQPEISGFLGEEHDAMDIDQPLSSDSTQSKVDAPVPDAQHEVTAVSATEKQQKRADQVPEVRVSQWAKH